MFYYEGNEQKSSPIDTEKPKEESPDTISSNKPQINYKNFFGFLKTCIENSIVPGSNAMSTTWELFMFPQPHLQAILQKELDAYLGFYSSKGTSQSCKTVSLVMHYAVLGYSHDFFKEKLKEASDVWKKNGYTEVDGAPLEFGLMSLVLSEKLGMTSHLDYVFLDEKKTKRLNLSPIEFLSSNYDLGIEKWFSPIYGTHFTAVMKSENPFKFYVLDSMPRNRIERKSYLSDYIEPLTWEEN